MMNAEHRRPFAAFMLVFAFACAIMANGLREQVVQVFVSSGAPRPLISAVLPDIVLGRSLRDVPAKPPAPSAVAEAKPSSEVPLTAERQVTLVTTRSTTAAAKPKRPHRGAQPAHHPTPAKPKPVGAVPAPTAPVAVPTTPSAPAPTTPSNGGTVRPNTSRPPQGLTGNGGSDQNWGDGDDPHGQGHSNGNGNGDWGHQGNGHDRGNRGDHGNQGDQGVRPTAVAGDNRDRHEHHGDHQGDHRGDSRGDTRGHHEDRGDRGGDRGDRGGDRGDRGGDHGNRDRSHDDRVRGQHGSGDHGDHRGH